MTGERQGTRSEDMTEELERRIAELEAALVEQDKSRQSLLAKLEDLQKSHQHIEQVRKEWTAAFDALHDPIFLHDRDHRILRANRAYAVRANMAIREIIGKPYWEVFPRGDGPMASCMKAMQEAEEEKEKEEEVTIPATGEVFLSRSFAVRDEQGAYQCSVHILEDVTEKRRAEAERCLLTEAIRQAAEAIVVADAAGRISYINPAFSRLFGYRAEEIIGESTAILAAPGVETVQPDEALRIVREQGGFQGEILRRTRDGAVIPAYVNVAAIYGAEGGFEGFVTAITDLRPIKEAQRRLAESEEMFRNIFEGALDGILLADAETKKFLTGNPIICRMLGYSPEELTRLGVPDIHPERDLPHVAEQFERQLRGESQLAADIPIRRKDGSVFYADIKSSPVCLGGRNYLLGVFRDITEKRQAEAQLRLFRDLLDHSNDGIFIVDPATSHFLDVNEAACRDLRYTREELLQRGVVDIQTALRDAVAWQTHVQELRAQGRALLEFDALRKDGSRFPVEASLRHTTVANQSYIIAMVRDITQRKEAEEALRRSNRALRVLSACNETLIHADEEGKLLQDMCGLVVEKGGYRLAWIGLAQDDGAKTIRPSAHAGFEEGYLESLHLTWADTERGRGPTGRAIRSGEPEIAQNIRTDTAFEPWRKEAMVRGYASSAAFPLRAHDKVLGALSIYSAEEDAFHPEEVGLLQELADDIAFGIHTLRLRASRERLQQENLLAAGHLRDALIGTIGAVALTVEKRDPYTAGHQQRVAQLAMAIAGELGIGGEQIEGIRLGALIHDIGKIYVPAEILSRPGKLTAAEFEIIKSHSQVGYDIIKDVRFPWPVGEMILQHHERLDGSGYPQGLKGEAIVIEARILAVADVVEAITSHRPYRPALGLDIALRAIADGRGTFYDADAVDTCIRLFRERGFAFTSP